MSVLRLTKIKVLDRRRLNGKKLGDRQKGGNDLNISS